MSDAAITIEGLGKRYRRGARPGVLRGVAAACRGRRVEREAFWALQDVSLEVPRGEVLGIIGPNGAGKSTLLKVLSRITEPTTGHVEIRGRVGSLLEVGTGFHPELTGRENVYLNGAVLGMTRAEVRKRFDAIVAFAGVEAFLDTPVKRYSSGMQTRLGFAVAAHLEPEVLIVDEVLAVGDAAFQRRCLGKMDDVAQSGRTVLLVSHNMGTLSGLCREVVLFRQGRLVQRGPAERVIGDYLVGDAKRGVVDLRDPAVERRGDGLARLTGLRVLDTATGRPIDAAVAGGDVTLEAAYAAPTDGPPLKRVALGLAVFTQRGHFATVFMTEMAGLRLETAPRRGVLRCRVPRLPLMSGLYGVQATLKVDGRMTDQVPAATTLEVERGDYFGSAMPNDAGLQGVYVDHAWDGPLDPDAAFDAAEQRRVA